MNNKIKQSINNKQPIAVRWRWPGYRWVYEDYKPDQFYSPRVEKELLYADIDEEKLEPAPGYCKHCKQYTIEEPLKVN